MATVPGRARRRKFSPRPMLLMVLRGDFVNVFGCNIV